MKYLWNSELINLLKMKTFDNLQEWNREFKEYQIIRSKEDWFGSWMTIKSGQRTKVVKCTPELFDELKDSI